VKLSHFDTHGGLGRSEGVNVHEHPLKLAPHDSPSKSHQGNEQEEGNAGFQLHHLD